MDNASHGHLVALDLSNLGTPIRSGPTAGALIDGSPEFTNWSLSRTADGQIAVGVWNSTPGVWHSKREETWEYCTLLRGIVEIEETGGASRRFKAGDSFVMKPGFQGIWRVIEEVRKVWVTYK